MSISAEFISQCRVLGMHSKASVFSVVLFLAAIALPAQAQNELQTSTNSPDSFSVSGSERFLQTADTGKFALIITGAAASPEIRQRFRGWTSQLDEILQRDYDYSADHVRILLDDGDNVGGLGARVAGASTADAIEEHLRDWQSDMTAGDLLSVFMIGHGAATFGDAKFNNVGPDMTGDELALWLEPYQEQDIVLFNMTNAGLNLPGHCLRRGGLLFLPPALLPSDLIRFFPVIYWPGWKGGRQTWIAMSRSPYWSCSISQAHRLLPGMTNRGDCQPSMPFWMTRETACLV